MNRKQQGDLGVAAAIFYFTRLGAVVSVPLTDNARYDLVVDEQVGPVREIFRYQVKTTGQLTPSGSYRVELSTQGGNQSWDGTIKYINEDEVDGVFVYCLDGSCYDIPVSLCADKRRLILGPKQAQYKVVDKFVDS